MSAAASGHPAAPPAYAELHCLTHFTFLRGASHPHELVQQALALGYSALAITDECSVAGVVRAHMAAKGEPTEAPHRRGIPLELRPEVRGAGDQSPRLRTAVPPDHPRPSRGAEGQLPPERDDVAAASCSSASSCGCPRAVPRAEELAWLAAQFPGTLRIAVELLREGADRGQLAQLSTWARLHGVPLVAAGDVHMHVRGRRLQDALTAIRPGVTVADAGGRLYRERRAPPARAPRLERLYPRAPAAGDAARSPRRCHFSLEELRYEYPAELVPAGETASSHLRAADGGRGPLALAAGRAAGGTTDIEQELALIAELRYEPYFLTVHDIVAFARSRGILCQGRGSAANSLVCYCLDITSVDPRAAPRCCSSASSRANATSRRTSTSTSSTSGARRCIQYVYRKYGRERAALAATVIIYRPRSALRDLGKAFGLSVEDSGRLASAMQWWDGSAAMAEHLREAGFDPEAAWLQRLLPLAQELVAFPASRVISRSTSAVSSSPRGCWRSWCRWRTPPCPSAPWCSGTRMTSTTWGC